jgi:hypothetical protein
LTLPVGIKTKVLFSIADLDTGFTVDAQPVRRANIVSRENIFKKGILIIRHLNF